MRRIVLAAVAGAALLVPVANAAGPPPPNFSGTVGHGFIGFQGVARHGHYVKVKNLSFEGIKGCDFTGGIADPIKVRHKRFHDTQPAAGVDGITVTVHGKFRDLSHAHGTIEISGDCQSGKKRWFARQNAE